MELYPGLYSVNLYLSGDTITYNNVHMPLFHFYVMQITRDIFRFRNHLSPSLQQRVTRRLSLVEQELLTLLQHLSPPRFFVGFVFLNVYFSYLCSFALFCFCFVFCFFVDRCLSFCTFSCCHSIVCPFAIYDFQLFLSYLQTFLICNHIFFIVILKNTCEIVMQNDKIIALC